MADFNTFLTKELVRVRLQQMLFKELFYRYTVQPVNMVDPQNHGALYYV